MNDFIQKVKYKPPEILKNNLDTFAQKFEVKRVPENIFPKTVNPPKKLNQSLHLNASLVFVSKGLRKQLTQKLE
jgi:hypothetical protein